MVAGTGVNRLGNEEREFVGELARSRYANGSAPIEVQMRQFEGQSL